MSESRTPRTDAITLTDRGAAGLLLDYKSLAEELESDLAEARAKVERLRKIMSHIDGLTVIKAKEAAGYGVQVRALAAQEQAKP